MGLATYKQILRHGHVIFPALAIFVSCMASAFFDPIMAHELSTYEILANKAGLVFCFFAFAFGLAGYITQWVPSAKNKHLILAGMLIIGTGFTLIAVSWDFEGSVNIITLGCVLNGMGTSISAVLSQVTMKQYCIRLYGRSVTGWVSGICSFMSLFGWFMGPLASPYLVGAFTFKLACFSMSGFVFTIALIVFLGITLSERTRKDIVVDET